MAHIRKIPQSQKLSIYAAVTWYNFTQKGLPLMAVAEKLHRDINRRNRSIWPAPCYTLPRCDVGWMRWLDLPFYASH